jgi:pimeloyl-ACP methyl ester carboxylesterase
VRHAPGESPCRHHLDHRTDTVVTFDLRGNSRSRLTGPPYEQHIGEHADDAHLLLRSVSDEPAYVFGNSYGAMIGMDLLVRFPEQVRFLVAHEPVVVEVLPDADRWHAIFHDVYDLFRRDGAGPAMRRLSAELGVDGPPEPADDLPPPAREMLARLKANMETCLAYELRSFTRFRPDLDALRDAPLVLAGGADGHETLPYRTTIALAERLGTRVVEFPGDHVGFLTHPHAFADAIRDEVVHGR